MLALDCILLIFLATGIHWNAVLLFKKKEKELLQMQVKRHSYTRKSNPALCSDRKISE